ncbi:metal-dependent hydrolase [bacterium]|nr:metal-dependent hydrolase [bacterium]
MADFRTHVTTSSVCGVAYGIVGNTMLGMPVTTSIIGGGLCAVSGMLPDLDSDNSTPVREMLSFGAAAIPMLLVDRFREYSMTPEEIVIASALVYAIVRFGVAAILAKCTVHRGMFHSIPALIIATLFAFVLSYTGDTNMRLFKAFGVSIGFFSHLLLDEIWAVRWTTLGPRTKKSFGTALKFFGEGGVANVVAYGILLLVGSIAFQEMSQPKKPTSIIVQQQPSGPSLVDRISSLIDSSRR